jgi:hypothetical protein
MTTASDKRRRGFLQPRRWRGAYCFPPSSFWEVLVLEKESLYWQRLEGKRLGERVGHLQFYLWGRRRDRGPGSWCVSREIWKMERLP